MWRACPRVRAHVCAQWAVASGAGGGQSVGARCYAHLQVKAHCSPGWTPSTH